MSWEPQTVKELFAKPRKFQALYNRAVQVGDHRAELSEAQQDWPKKILENPERSPLLSAAAHIRGFIDTLIYLAQQLLLWIVEMLGLLDTLLEHKLGQGWWKQTNLRSFEPNTPTS